MPQDLAADVDAIGRIAAIPTMLDVICRTTGMGFAAVARVTEDRWVACRVQDEIGFGLVPGGELKIETTICNEIREHCRPVIIDHVAEDPDFSAHHTPAMYGFQSYISLPIIRPDGSFFGTLCAIDPRPAKLHTPAIIGMFELFAQLIGFHLDAIDRMTENEAALLGERETAALRDQFIAVLGHDLRNPIAAVAGGMRLLTREDLSDKGRNIVSLIDKSVNRMSALIDNVLDFARGRLGGGIALSRMPGGALQPALEQVVDELRSAHPGRSIESDFELGPIDGDAARIGQLFSNLLGNALTHGAPGAPVRATARVRDDWFELAVANEGDPIPPEAMERLFSPFSRGEVRPSAQGLGLGLYIATEIAKAHGGTLGVVSTGEETCFTFRMPIRSA